MKILRMIDDFLLRDTFRPLAGWFYKKTGQDNFCLAHWAVSGIFLIMFLAPIKEATLAFKFLTSLTVFVAMSLMVFWSKSWWEHDRQKKTIGPGTVDDQLKLAVRICSLGSAIIICFGWMMGDRYVSGSYPLVLLNGFLFVASTYFCDATQLPKNHKDEED